MRALEILKNGRSKESDKNLMPIKDILNYHEEVEKKLQNFKNYNT